MNEILNLLEEDNDVRDIFIQPPEEGDDTDEDSGKEDSETSLNPNNLSGNQLRAPAEFRVTSKTVLDDTHFCSNDYMSQDYNDSESDKKKRKITK